MRKPVHERLRDAADALGLTAEDIAKRAEWSERKVQRLLSGATDLKVEHVEILARILKCPIEFGKAKAS